MAFGEEPLCIKFNKSIFILCAKKTHTLCCIYLRRCWCCFGLETKVIIKKFWPILATQEVTNTYRCQSYLRNGYLCTKSAKKLWLLLGTVSYVEMMLCTSTTDFFIRFLKSYYPPQASKRSLFWGTNILLVLGLLVLLW